MLEGLAAAILQAELMKAQIEMQETVDAYYAAAAEQGNRGDDFKFTVTYDVTTRGEVEGDLEEFRQVVAETFADARGWRRASVKFVEVEAGAEAKMHMILASPAEVDNASVGCSDKLSCTVKPSIYINDERWMNGSDSYNELGVSLGDYRRMVINHETGHYLGHNHIASCETNDGLAPIMLQQSTGLLGCKANAWPLPNELWVNGIE